MADKIAILGVCNTRNVLEASPCKGLFNIVFYGFQNNFIGITRDGLDIPLKDFYKSPIVPKDESYAEFTRRMMFCDLNKTSLKAIESLNPKYLLIDLSTIAMKTYSVSYNNKSVYSCNAYSPECYEKLKKDVGISFEKVDLEDKLIEESITEFAEYLKKNWDLSKLIIFNYTKADYYIDPKMKKIEKYPEDFWSVKQQQKISKFTKFFIEKLNYPKLKIFNDADLKVCKNKKEQGIPSMFHYEDHTIQYQSCLFRNFILNCYSKEDLLKIKNKIIETYNLS